MNSIKTLKIFRKKLTRKEEKKQSLKKIENYWLEIFFFRLISWAASAPTACHVPAEKRATTDFFSH